MESDLKIIFYIVVAIIWIVYNNYRKIAGESRKRNPAEPPDEVIRENWPPVTDERRERSTSPRPPIVREPLKRKLSPVAEPSGSRSVRDSGQRYTDEIVVTTSMLDPADEGGRIRPSGMVHFEEPSLAPGRQVTQIERLRHTDLQTAFIWSEVFKNPYNQSLETMKHN